MFEDGGNKWHSSCAQREPKQRASLFLVFGRPQVPLRQTVRLFKVAVENLPNLDGSPIKHVVLQIPLDALTIPFGAAREQP